MSEPFALTYIVYDGTLIGYILSLITLSPLYVLVFLLYFIVVSNKNRFRITFLFVSLLLSVTLN